MIPKVKKGKGKGNNLKKCTLKVHIQGHLFFP